MFGFHSLPLAHKIVIHFGVPCLHLHNCYLLKHPGVIQQCSGHPELSGWMASLACLTGNRCVSSEDEGPADKHYWKTSAACHNTGQAGTSPSHHHHPSATPESRCVGGVRGNSSSIGHHPLLTPCWMWSTCSVQAPACLNQIRAFLASGGKKASVHLKNEHSHTHTLHHWCYLLMCLPQPTLDYCLSESGMALIFYP